MKKMKLIAVLLMVTFTVAFCQPDKIFKEQVTFEKGFKFLDGTTMTTAATGGTGSMVYPAAGIPLSNGTAWGTSIVNNSNAWNTAVTEAHTAFLWGNHANLYRAITWKPTYSTDILGLPTFATVATSGKYIDLLEKPAEVELSVAISQMKGVMPPRYTTAQIDALVMTSAEEGLEVWDLTLHVRKQWNGTVWKITPTTN